MVRFRTLGCYPLTGAVESNADTLPEIIQEMLLDRTSERQGRVIDHDEAGSMEEKKTRGLLLSVPTHSTHSIAQTDHRTTSTPTCEQLPSARSCCAS